MSAHTASGMTRIFVYGTLRRGQRNHHLLAAAHFVGAGATVAHYTLRVEGTLPYLDAREARYPVRGEVYELAPPHLLAIDRLERHPTWYRRCVISVRLDRHALSDADGDADGDVRGEMVAVYAYFHPEAPGIVHPTGDYTEPLFKPPDTLLRDPLHE